jgi:hypothetical protein
MSDPWNLTEAQRRQFREARAEETERRRAQDRGRPRRVTVNVMGREVTVDIHDGWRTLGPVVTAARWRAGCGELPFDNFEVRDDTGRLLDPHTALGGWLAGTTLYVNRLAGIGA